jgi:hypothetical protein
MTKRIIEWEKCIRIWVTLKRVTNKIRSVYGPLIRDDERRLNSWSIEWVLKRILGIGIFGGWSEKGSSREITENRVTRWIFMFRGNLVISRCFTKRIKSEEFGFSFFWAFGRESTGCHWGGGTVNVSFWCVRGNLSVLGLKMGWPEG